MARDETLLSELLSHVGCALTRLLWRLKERGRCEHLPASPAGRVAGWAGCRSSQGQPRMAGTGAFQGGGGWQRGQAVLEIFS